jgi:hypothetical protein
MSLARGGRPRILGLTIALVFTSSSTIASAETTSPVRVVIRTITPLDEALYERTVGQVSDLSAELQRASSSALEPTMTERLAEARVLAGRLDASMVVWFEHPSASENVVLVALPSRARVLVRPVETTSGSTSAMLEASSLVVRTALLALEAGAQLGVPNEDVTRDTAPAPPPIEPAPEPRLPPPKHALAAREPASWSAFLNAGWQLGIDGRSPAGARAATLEAGVYLGAWTASLRGAAGLPSRSHDDLVSLEVSRHALGALVGRTLVGGDVWQIDLLAGAGLVAFRRSAYPRDARFSPSPPTTQTSFAGAIEARVLWTPAPRFPMRLGSSLGADAIASPPSFTYETATGVVEQASWFVEPRIAFFASLQW